MRPVTLGGIVAALQGLAAGVVDRETVSVTEELLRSAGLDTLEDVDDFLDMCASFRPGGGEYLYDEASIAKAARSLLPGLD